MSNIEQTVDLGHDELGLAIIHKHGAHRLVQHTLQVVEMAWTDDSTLGHLLLHVLLLLPPSRCRESGNKEKRHCNRLPAVMSITLATE